MKPKRRKFLRDYYRMVKMLVLRQGLCLEEAAMQAANVYDYRARACANPEPRCRRS